MIKIVLSLWLAVLGLVWARSGEAQTVSGAIMVVKQDLPEARIVVTGKGYPPKKDIPGTKKKLLAQRAATVDAYRVMSSVLNGVSGYIAEGTGAIKTSGYIRGAEVSNVRYYINGKVEVDLILPIIFLQKGVVRRVDWDGILRDISCKGYPVYYTEKQTKQITEEEWLKMQRNR